MKKIRFQSVKNIFCSKSNRFLHQGIMLLIFFQFCKNSALSFNWNYRHAALIKSFIQLVTLFYGLPTLQIQKYRLAIDNEGKLVDMYLSDVRDQADAERFFKKTKNTTGITPKKITAD